MSKKTLEYKMLKGIKFLSRKNAQVNVDPRDPWPDCLFLLHQPKRPTRNNEQ